MLIVLFVIIITIIISIQALSGPSHGNITTSSSSRVLISSLRKTRPITSASDIRTTYFQLALPAGYAQQSSGTDTPGLLYQQTIIKGSTSGSLTIAIALSSLGSGLNDNSAYSLRLRDPARYKMTTRTVQGESVVIANDVQAAAVVAFWTHGDKLATISASSVLQNPAADDNADEIKALQPLLNAWQWQ